MVKQVGYPPARVPGSYGWAASYPQMPQPIQPPQEVMTPDGPRLVPAVPGTMTVMAPPNIPAGTQIPQVPRTPFYLDAMNAVNSAGRTGPRVPPMVSAYTQPQGGGFDIGGLLGGIGTQVASLGSQAMGAVNDVAGKAGNLATQAGQKVVEVTQNPLARLLASIRPAPPAGPVGGDAWMARHTGTNPPPGVMQPSGASSLTGSTNSSTFGSLADWQAAGSPKAAVVLDNGRWVQK